MPSSTRNVNLGICKVYFDGKDLGYTKGGVEVSVTTETYRSEIDQFGRTAINELVQGRNVQVTAPLAETTLENLVEIMPGSTFVSDGVRASGTLTSSGTQPTATTGTLTIGTITFTYVSGVPTGPTQIKIGANIAETLRNTVFAINNYGWMATNASGVYLTPAAAAVGGLRAVIDPTNANRIIVSAVERSAAGNSIQISGTAASNFTPTTATALTSGANITRARVDVSLGTDVDMLNISRVLRLHPIKKAETDLSDDFIVWNAAPAGSLQFSYQQEAERIFNVTFSAYPDPNQGSNPRLFSVGDPHYQP